MNRIITILVASIVLGRAFPAIADPSTFDRKIKPLFSTYCLKCHSGEKPKGDFALADLPADFSNPTHRKLWRNVLEKLEAGEMPPKEKPRPSEAEARVLTAWIGENVRAADLRDREAQGRVVLRRLNRNEYENTVHDLMGIAIPLKDALPQDTSQNGFDNVGEALHTSSFLLDKYLEAAQLALDAAITNEPKPPPSMTKRYFATEAHEFKSSQERVYRKLDENAVAMFSSSAWNAITLAGFYPQNRGVYRFRICTHAIQSDGKPVTYKLLAGRMESTFKPHLVGYFDSPADKPQVMEFTDYLEAKSTIRILPYGLATSQTVNKVGAADWDGPGLVIDWVEAEGPINETWPPESHRRIFGDLPQTKAPTYNHSNRVEVTSAEPSRDARRIVRDFARRAFRRPATETELQPYFALVEARLAEKYSFEQAVRVGLGAVMVSPEFLFLHERPGRLDDFALASRLSYFLWSSMPDEPLLAAAERHELSQPAALRAQVERMLNSPKAAAFTTNFVGQWLNLRDIDATMPSHQLYPEFDDMLQASMLKETELFFDEIVKNDLSLTNFIASDFSMLNGRLAKHYGIPGVDGWTFHNVLLPPESHRGGLLTMASVLKVTANGTSTSPVLRGAWVLDRILGTPPQPPPPNAGTLEPDTRGATTIRQQLDKHRQLESCAVCHVKIDPPGFALESFDVIGGYRDHYRATGNGKPVTIDGKRMPYLEGKPVDPSAALPDGRRFENVDQFKALLLSEKDQVAWALAVRLITYATGAPPQSLDRPAVDAILANVRAKNYGFRTLIHQIVQSPVFLEK